jgi:hypothetical protein
MRPKEEDANSQVFILFFFKKDFLKGGKPFIMRGLGPVIFRLRAEIPLPGIAGQKKYFWRRE